MVVLHLRWSAVGQRRLIPWQRVVLVALLRVCRADIAVIHGAPGRSGDRVGPLTGLLADAGHVFHRLLGLMGDVSLDEDAAAVGVAQKLGLELQYFGHEAVEARRKVPVLVFHRLLTAGQRGGFVTLPQPTLRGSHAVPLQDVRALRAIGQRSAVVVIEPLQLLVVARWGGRIHGDIFRLAAAFFGLGLVRLLLPRLLLLGLRRRLLWLLLRLSTLSPRRRYSLGLLVADV